MRVLRQKNLTTLLYDLDLTSLLFPFLQNGYNLKKVKVLLQSERLQTTPWVRGWGQYPHTPTLGSLSCLWATAAKREGFLYRVSEQL